MKLVTIQVREDVAVELQKKYGRLPRFHPNGSSVKFLFGEPVQGIETVILCAKSMKDCGGVEKSAVEELMLSIGYAERPVDSPLSILLRDEIIIEQDGKLFLPPADCDKGRIARQSNTRKKLVKKLQEYFTGE